MYRVKEKAPAASVGKTAAINGVRYERNDLQPLCSEPPASGANGGSKEVRGTSTFATYVELANKALCDGLQALRKATLISAGA